MFKRRFRKASQPDWWVVGPYIFNLVLWVVIIWGAHALHERANQPGDVMIADLRPEEPERR